VENVTIPERSVVEPSQSLVKTWKVTNPGSVDWPEGSKLIFLRGDRSVSSEEEFPVPPCKAGETVDVSALVVSPATPGRHTAVFRLADAERIPFGPRLWCDFVVGDPTKVESKSDVKTVSPASPVPSAPTAPMPPVSASPASPAPSAPSAPPAPSDPRKAKYAVQLEALRGMGFADEEMILNLLEVNEGNVQTVCENLLNAMR